MPSSNDKLISVDQLGDSLGTFASKADNRFSKGAGIQFAVNGSNEISGTYGGNPIVFPGGGGGGGGAVVEDDLPYTTTINKDSGGNITSIVTVFTTIDTTKTVTFANPTASTQTVTETYTNTTSGSQIKQKVTTINNSTGVISQTVTTS